MWDNSQHAPLSHLDSWPFPPGQGPSKRQRLPNVTTLSEAGITFKKGSKMNIVFENGVLTIPPLAIDERTEPIFRNLIAFEQCQYSKLHHCPMTLYAFLMDNLIDSSKDIDLLHESGIVANWLSPEDAAQLFNELCNDTAVIGFYGRWRVLFYDLNKYCNAKCNKWMEKLRREHFGTPRAIISLVAAFILLVLTMLRTVYTIHQYYHPINLDVTEKFVCYCLDFLSLPTLKAWTCNGFLCACVKNLSYKFRHLKIFLDKPVDRI